MPFSADEVRGRLSVARWQDAERTIEGDATLRNDTRRTMTEDAPLDASAATATLDLPSIPIVRPDGARAPSVVRTADLSEIRVIGQGGMGRVLLAKQRSLVREVAVKVLHERATAADSEALIQEGRMAGALEHPAIVPVHALGVDDVGRPILVMKRIEGISWRDLLEDPLHPGWAGRGDDRLAANLEILMCVCDALELAHDRNVVHRDLKPANVMVGKFGEVYLVDWGLAVPIGEGEPLVGTLRYIAPEMAVGAPVDARTDVYLLGATLHRVLTGRPRHDFKQLGEIIEAAMASPPFRYGPDVPVPLAALCNEATAREPERRVPSARAFRERLLTFLRRRSALELCAAASASLRRLETLLAAAPVGRPPEDPVGAYALASEARFGLRESLKIDPESITAQQTMRHCIATMIDLELRSNHVEAAELLLADVTPADPALVERVERAKEAAAARSLEIGRLEEVARDRDPTFSVSVRVALAIVILLTFAIGIPFLVSATRDERERTMGSLFSILAALGSSVLATVIFRKRLDTSFNRAIVTTVLGGEVLILIDRVCGLVTERSISITLRNDLLIIAAVIVPLAAIMFPRAWLAAGFSVLGVIAIELVPRQAQWMYGATFLCVAVAFVWAMWTRRRERDASAIASRFDDRR